MERTVIMIMIAVMATIIKAPFNTLYCNIGSVGIRCHKQEKHIHPCNFDAPADHRDHPGCWHVYPDSPSKIIAYRPIHVSKRT